MVLERLLCCNRYGYVRREKKKKKKLSRQNMIEGEGEEMKKRSIDYYYQCSYDMIYYCSLC